MQFCQVLDLTEQKRQKQNLKKYPSLREGFEERRIVYEDEAIS